MNTFFNCAKKRGYAGVCVYSRLEPKMVESFLVDEEGDEDTGVKRFNSEGRFLKLSFPKFTLINVYMPQVGINLIWVIS